MTIQELVAFVMLLYAAMGNNPGTNAMSAEQLQEYRTPLVSQFYGMGVPVMDLPIVTMSLQDGYLAYYNKGSCRQGKCSGSNYVISENGVDPFTLAHEMVHSVYYRNEPAAQLLGLEATAGLQEQDATNAVLYELYYSSMVGIAYQIQDRPFATIRSLGLPKDAYRFVVKHSWLHSPAGEMYYRNYHQPVIEAVQTAKKSGTPVVYGVPLDDLKQVVIELSGD